ncbi:hypothetical protein ACFY1P_33290 [Streptomyces sp. NPDC001407]|uniref:hypothetical protein n=1 Tax=Streptomyces sp. NPDC001407 TaxID=3364573 RepID=UPI0036C8422C
MPENMPTNRAQLTPAQVQIAFDYILAVDAGDDDTVDRLAAEILPHTGVLVAIAEEIVFPMTALSDDIYDINADSFVLDELGVIFLMAIRAWAHKCRASAASTIAHCIVHFTAQIFADEPKDVTRTLEAMRDERLERARAVHSTPGAHQ